MNDLFIPILLGTSREGRRSERVAEYVLSEFRKTGAATELIDVRDFAFSRTIPPWEADPTAQRWREFMARADGLIVVSPEYNHGYPGELKLLLDTAYEEYAHKPMAFCGVSSSMMGGGRMVEALHQVAIEFKMVPCRNAGYFANVKTLFDDQGRMLDNEFSGRLVKVFEELLWYAHALKAARHQIK